MKTLSTALIVGMALAGGTVAACVPPHPGTRAIDAVNETDTTLTFEMLLPDDRLPLLGEVEPGMRGGIIIIVGEVPATNRALTQDGCTVGDIVALDPDGREVARHPPPLCLGETWTIQTTGVPTGSPASS